MQAPQQSGCWTRYDGCTPCGHLGFASAVYLYMCTIYYLLPSNLMTFHYCYFFLVDINFLPSLFNKFHQSIQAKCNIKYQDKSIFFYNFPPFVVIASCSTGGQFCQIYEKVVIGEMLIIIHASCPNYIEGKYFFTIIWIIS